MPITGRTIARLAQPFEGGGGPTHGTIERIWTSGDASEYLGEGNKMERVLSGLRNLQEGRRAAPGQPALAADEGKLAWVTSELATLLVAQGLVDEDTVAEALDTGEAHDSSRPQRRSEDGCAQPVHAPEIDTRRAEAAQAEDTRAVMVVHGQDAGATRAVFDWLRSVGLRPAEWNQLVNASGAAAPFIGQVLDTAFARAQAVVVVFTPDEHVRLREELSEGEPLWRLQARPNVLFEAGMAFARHPTRTVLVVLGEQDIPSDLAGRHYLKLDRAQALRDLAQRLEAAGCPVDLTGNDWLDIERFPIHAVSAMPTI